MPPSAAYSAIILSALAVVVWLLLMARILRKLKCGDEHRPFILAMPVVGLVASVGTLASAIGLAQLSGAIDFRISNEMLAVVASMGRGGLLMGGVIALAYYRPPHHKQ